MKSPERKIEEKVEVATEGDNITEINQISRIGRKSRRNKGKHDNDYNKIDTKETSDTVVETCNEEIELGTSRQDSVQSSEPYDGADDPIPKIIPPSPSSGKKKRENKEVADNTEDFDEEHTVSSHRRHAKQKRKKSKKPSKREHIASEAPTYKEDVDIEPATAEPTIQIENADMEALARVPCDINETDNQNVEATHTDACNKPVNEPEIACPTIVEKQIDLDFEKLDLDQLQSQPEQHETTLSALTEDNFAKPPEETSEAPEASEILPNATSCKENALNLDLGLAAEPVADISNEKLDENVKISHNLSTPSVEVNQCKNNELQLEAIEDDTKREITKEQEPILISAELNVSPNVTENNIPENYSEGENHQESDFDVDSEKPPMNDSGPPQEEVIKATDKSETEYNEVIVEQIEHNEGMDNNVVIENSIPIYEIIDESVERDDEGIDETKDMTESHEEKEMNAAEQILDEISNLTSSIDIILDAERAEDEVELRFEGMVKSAEMEETIQMNPETETENSKNNETDVRCNVPISENTETPEVEFPTEKEMFDRSEGQVSYDDHKEDGDKNYDESDPLALNPEPVDTTEELQNGNSRKRKNHLKYTPPKVFVQSESSSALSPDYEKHEILPVEEINENVAPPSMQVNDAASVDNIRNESLVVEVRVLDQSGEIITNEMECSRSQCSSVANDPKDIPVITTLGITEHDNTLSQKSPTSLTVNMLRFDCEPTIQPSQPFKSIRETGKIEKARQSKPKDEYIGGSNSFETSPVSVISAPVPESKPSGKRRLSRLKDQISKPQVTATISEEIQERFKVYSFDEQSDGIEVPKKSKYSTSKENKNDRNTSRADGKSHNTSEGSKSYSMPPEKPKYSRSRQVNLQNVSDVCIPKFPKIDRSKRTISHPESNVLTRNEIEVKETKTLNDNYLLPYGNTTMENTSSSNVHLTTPTSTKLGRRESPSNLNSSIIEMDSPLAVRDAHTTTRSLSAFRLSQPQVNVVIDSEPISNYGEIRSNTSSTPVFPTNTTSTSKKKSTRPSQSKRSKQQQPQQVQIQSQFLPHNFYDPFSAQQSFEMNVQPTGVITKEGKSPPKEKSSRKQISNSLEEPTPSFTLNQGSPMESRGHVISSQTIVMTGPPLTPAKGPVIKTCAGDPLFITSKGNLIASNSSTTTYSTAYLDSQQHQQREPDLIHSVAPFTSQTSSQVTYSASSPKIAMVESRTQGTQVQSRRTSNTADISRDKSSCNLAEIKRLEQKPTGKVLTAHGFNELAPVEGGVMHGKMSVRESGSVDLPILVPIGEPHAPAQRMTTKRSSHGTKDVASGPSRSSKQMRNNHGNGVSQQNLLSGKFIFLFIDILMLFL